MAAAAAPRKCLILQTNYAPNTLEKRVPFREQHLQAGQTQVDAGKLILAGPYGDPVEGGMFVWKDSTEQVLQEIEAYVKADAYFINGFITSWSIKPYTVLVGGN